MVGTSICGGPALPSSHPSRHGAAGTVVDATLPFLKSYSRRIGLYGCFLLKRDQWRSWPTVSAVTGCCAHCTMPLAQASRSAFRRWTPWGHHLYSTSVVTSQKRSKVGIVAVLKDKLIRVHVIFHFREHMQLATDWFLSTKMAITVLPRAIQLLPMAFPELQSTALN